MKNFVIRLRVCVCIARQRREIDKQTTPTFTDGGDVRTQSWINGNSDTYPSRVERYDITNGGTLPEPRRFLHFYATADGIIQSLDDHYTPLCCTVKPPDRNAATIGQFQAAGAVDVPLAGDFSVYDEIPDLGNDKDDLDDDRFISNLNASDG